MKVKELIEELEKCNRDDIVMYDMENAFTNQENLKGESSGHERDFFELGVDDVAIGNGTLQGFVFLRENIISDVPESVKE